MNDDVLSWIFDHSWGTGTPPQSRNWGQQVGMELVFSSTQPLIVLIRPPSAFYSFKRHIYFLALTFDTQVHSRSELGLNPCFSNPIAHLRHCSSALAFNHKRCEQYQSSLLQWFAAGTSYLGWNELIQAFSFFKLFLSYSAYFGLDKNYF